MTPVYRLIRTEPNHTELERGPAPLRVEDGDETITLDSPYEGGPLGLEAPGDFRIYPINLRDGEAIEAGAWRVERDDSIGSRPPEACQ